MTRCLGPFSLCDGEWGEGMHSVLPWPPSHPHPPPPARLTLWSVSLDPLSSVSHPGPGGVQGDSFPAAPCGQQLCSTRLCSTLLSSAPGRPPPPCPPPSPLLPLSPLTDHSLEGVGTPGLDTPHRGPRAQLIGRSHGRTQDPGALRWAVCQGPSQLPQGQCQLGMQPPQGS